MSLKYKIYPEKSLLIDELSDSITLKDLLDFHATYRNDENIIFVYKVLTNVIGANFKMSLDEMLTYIDELKKEVLPSSFKWAILTETPNSTMFSILIKEEPYFKGKVGVFSTLKASTAFLNIDFIENDFNCDL